MKIRRYLASNTQEAILKVKMDLGNDALILNTRKVRQKGLFKIFSKPMVEVLAAIDEYSNAKKEPEAAREVEKVVVPAKPPKEKTNFDEKEEKIASLENKVNNMEEMLQKIYEQVQGKGTEKPPEKDREKGQDLEREQARGREEERTRTLERPAIREIPPKAEEREPASVTVPKVLQTFHGNLLKSEVEAEFARKIIEGVSAKVGVNPNLNETASVLYSMISGTLGKPETIQAKQNGRPTVAIFVGPTGVGKTTTLAKIAANLLLNQKKTVGMITADTYRIAAVEQLKTYAEILGIPVSVVYSPGEISEAIAQHADKDIILIDTAGRSHRNKAQFEELKGLIAASGADEVFLVLSATTSIRNCREILSNYDFLKDYKLIFTKTDEAPVLGIVFNVRYLTGKKLSYITNGQSVPDDIEIANIDKITKNLMGSIG